jgi:hypothetical protein
MMASINGQVKAVVFHGGEGMTKESASSGVICSGVIYDEVLRLREEVAELKRKDNINALNYAIAIDTVKRLRGLLRPIHKQLSEGESIDVDDWKRLAREAAQGEGEGNGS